jgi:hypothetical protein
MTHDTCRPQGHGGEPEVGVGYPTNGVEDELEADEKVADRSTTGDPTETASLVCVSETVA